MKQLKNQDNGYYIVTDDITGNNVPVGKMIINSETIVFNIPTSSAFVVRRFCSGFH